MAEQVVIRPQCAQGAVHPVTYLPLQLKYFRCWDRVWNALRFERRERKTNAGGFSIESLTKLSQVKAWDKKTTLLFYITSTIQKWNEPLLDVKDELPNVLKTQNMMDYETSLRTLEQQLESVRSTTLLLNSDVEGITDELLQQSSIGVFALEATATGQWWFEGEIQWRFELSSTRGGCEADRSFRHSYIVLQWFGLGPFTVGEESWEEAIPWHEEIFIVESLYVILNMIEWSVLLLIWGDSFVK